MSVALHVDASNSETVPSPALATWAVWVARSIATLNVRLLTVAEAATAPQPDVSVALHVEPSITATVSFALELLSKLEAAYSVSEGASTARPSGANGVVKLVGFALQPDCSSVLQVASSSTVSEKGNPSTPRSHRGRSCWWTG